MPGPQRDPWTTIVDKSLGTLLHFWGIFQFTQAQPLPSPHKQFWMRVSRIFSEFQLCIGWGEGELQEDFETGCAVLRGNLEMTEKYEYCSTVPRTFVLGPVARSLVDAIHWLTGIKMYRFP